VPALRDRLNLFACRFVLALQRATRLPAATVPADDPHPRGSDRHLPGAGAVIGLLAAFVFAIFGLLLRGNPAGPAVAAVASLFAVVVLTGAAQESAVFRLAEGFDRGGGHGVIALVLLLAARLAGVAAVGAVSEPGVLATLLAGPVVSRFAPLVAAHWATHASGEDATSVRVAALWCVVPLVLLGFAGGIACALLALAGTAAAWIGLLRFFRHRPGSFDDARGAALQQACEAAFYLGASLGA